VFVNLLVFCLFLSFFLCFFVCLLVYWFACLLTRLLASDIMKNCFAELGRLCRYDSSSASLRDVR